MSPFNIKQGDSDASDALLNSGEFLLLSTSSLKIEAAPLLKDEFRTMELFFDVSHKKGRKVEVTITFIGAGPSVPPVSAIC